MNGALRGHLYLRLFRGGVYALIAPRKRMSYRKTAVPTDESTIHATGVFYFNLANISATNEPFHVIVLRPWRQAIRKLAATERHGRDQLAYAPFAVGVVVRKKVLYRRK